MNFPDSIRSIFFKFIGKMGFRFEYRLRVKSIKTKEGLDTLSDLLNYFDIEDAVTRYSAVRELFDFGLRHAPVPSLKVSMELFLEGIKSYFFGFDEAAVFYSSLSIELMLLHKAIGKSKRNELPKTPDSKFWWLIHKAGILDQEHVMIAENLRLLRNCYVHLSNRILYDRMIFEESLRFIETYEDERTPRRMKNEILANVKILQRLLETIFPSFSPLLHNKNIDFMKKRYELYHKSLQKEKKRSSDNLLRYGLQELLRTKQRRFDAFDALNWSKSIMEFCIHHM